MFLDNMRSVEALGEETKKVPLFFDGLFLSHQMSQPMPNGCIVLVVGLPS